MATPISSKLHIKPNNKLVTINAPVDFKKAFNELPKGVSITATEKKPVNSKYDQVHWFVLNKAQLEQQLSNLLKLLKPGILVWVYFPKGSSNLQTDLTRDKGWDKLLAQKDKLTWINLISFNDTWSGVGFRAKTAADEKKESKKEVREIFNWVNPKTKEIKLSGDLLTAFKKNSKEKRYFDTLSFTNKKEYIEWIVTAKREQTRNDRIAGTINRLKQQWKNPGNV